MIIKLKTDLPIDRKHEALKDNEYEVTGEWRGLYYFIGAAGEECGAHPQEFEIIEE